MRFSNNVVCATSKASDQPSLVALTFYNCFANDRTAFGVLKGGCTGSSESIHVKMPHLWKSHVTAHYPIVPALVFINGLTVAFWVAVVHRVFPTGRLRIALAFPHH